MWNILKPIIRWPLKSPLRLTGVIAAVAILIITLTALTTNNPTPAANTSTQVLTATPSESEETTESVSGDRNIPSPSLTPRLPGETERVNDPNYLDGTGQVDGGSQELVAMAAADAAVAYVNEWSHPERSVDEWLAGLAPYVTERHYVQLTSVDPTNVAQTMVIGEPIEEAMYLDSAVLAVPTTGEYIRVYLHVNNAGIWLVDSAEPLR